MTNDTIDPLYTNKIGVGIGTGDVSDDGLKNELGKLTHSRDNAIRHARELFHDLDGLSHGNQVMSFKDVISFIVEQCYKERVRELGGKFGQDRVQRLEKNST